MTIKFKVLGQPKGKARPRFTKNGYKFTGEPLSVSIIAYLKRAKTNKRPFATSKPDIDNLVKTVLDGLNGIAFKDDSQIVNITAASCTVPTSMICLLR